MSSFCSDCLFSGWSTYVTSTLPAKNVSGRSPNSTAKGNRKSFFNKHAQAISKSHICNSIIIALPCTDSPTESRSRVLRDRARSLEAPEHRTAVPQLRQCELVVAEPERLLCGAAAARERLRRDAHHSAGRRSHCHSVGRASGTSAAGAGDGVGEAGRGCERRPAHGTHRRAPAIWWKIQFVI